MTVNWSRTFDCYQHTDAQKDPKTRPTWQGRQRTAGIISDQEQIRVERNERNAKN